MSRGLYSALGWWSKGASADELHAVVERLRRIDPRTIPEIAVFEARVGHVCGLHAELVQTPEGPAIELGNIAHLGFGAEHEAAAMVVAEALARVLVTHGATRTVAITRD